MRVVVALLLCSAAANAQSLRGTVMRGTHGVAGAVVILRDSSGATVGRALSHDAGEFFVSAPRPGRYQVQVLRIGYAPAIAGFHDLTTGATTTTTLRIESLPVQLAAENVEGQKVCRGRQDSAAIAFAYWEQARTALLAATLTDAKPYVVKLTSWERATNGAEQRNPKTGQTTRPYFSLPPDTLAARGYIVPDGGGIAYWAPDAEVLLSPSFATTHCFSLARGTPREINIAFEPVRNRRDAADIRGIIVIDRRSKYLRLLDFKYVSRASMVEQSESGGFVAFTPLPDGGWIVPHWQIRVPVAVGTLTQAEAMPGENRMAKPLTRTRTFGGDIDRIERDGRVLWQPGRIPFSVDIRDSSGFSAPIGTLVWVADDSSARIPATDENGFAQLENVIEGNRRLKILTPSHDSLGLPPFEVSVRADSAREEPTRVIIPSAVASPRSLCNGVSSQLPPGMVYGSAKFAVAGSDSMTAVATWQTLFIRPTGGTVVKVETRRATVGTNGRYQLCALPLRRTLQVQVALGNQKGPLSYAELTPERDVAWLALTSP